MSPLPSLSRLKMLPSSKSYGSYQPSGARPPAQPPQSPQSTHKTLRMQHFSDLVLTSVTICFTCMCWRSGCISPYCASAASHPFHMMFLCLCLGQAVGDSTSPPPFVDAKMNLEQFLHGLRCLVSCVPLSTLIPSCSLVGNPTTPAGLKAAMEGTPLSHSPIHVNLFSTFIRFRETNPC